MDIASSEAEAAQKFFLVSFRFSNIGIFSWDRPTKMMKEVLKKYGFKIYLYIKIFGEDEVWAITSLEENANFEEILKEPFVAYAASLENSLPLDLVTVDTIIKDQLPVGYLFFKGEEEPISLREIQDLVKKKGGYPFLVGEINHPDFSYFAALTGGSTEVYPLAKAAHEVMGFLKYKKWKCYLGVEHIWEGYGEEEKEKMAMARLLMKHIRRWARSMP